MTQTLTISLKDGPTVRYRYEDGLRAVCEALETARYSDFTDIEIEVVVES